MDSMRIVVTADGTATYGNGTDKGRRGVMDSLRALISKPTEVSGGMVQDVRADAAMLCSDIDLAFLPEACRMHECAGEIDIYVTEHLPTVRRTVWSEALAAEQCGDRTELCKRLLRSDASCKAFSTTEAELTRRILHADGPQEFYLATPYVVYVHRFAEGIHERSYLFFRNAPVRSAEDALCYPCCGNTDNFGRIGITSSGVDRVAPIEAQAFAVEQLAWDGCWERVSADERHCPKQIATPWDWALETQRDPHGVLAFSWATFPTKIGEIVDRLLCVRDRERDPLDIAIKAPTAFELLLTRGFADVLIVDGEEA
ncbi:MAG: hypothetical protein ABIG71_00945 [Candidatus Uhrbacteria bacterium]